MPSSIDRRLDQLARRLERERECATKAAQRTAAAQWEIKAARARKRVIQEELRQLRWKARYREKFGMEPPGPPKKIPGIF